MHLEVLVSCMNQQDLSIVDKLNLHTNAVIINQFDNNSYLEKVIRDKEIKFITSKQRGLTKSRNHALAYANGDICILCDDDMEYVDNYEEIIINAFRELPDADIIIFDIERLNYDGFIEPISKIRRAPRFKAYGSVRIAFRLNSILKNNMYFDVNFGSGSVYSSGEESIFLNDAHIKQMKIYEYPAIIARVDFKESTWRTGYDEKFFYDKGALLSATHPKLKYIFMVYYILRFYKITELNKKSISKWICLGINSYKDLMSFDEYMERK